MKTFHISVSPQFLIPISLALFIACSFAPFVSAQDAAKNIPANLTAEEYLVLSKKNVMFGDCEVARECAKRAAKLGRGGPVATRANMLLDSNIPRFPVALTAQRQNNQAMDLIMKNKFEPAIALLEDTVAEYPKFEWPFYNLACAYLNKKNPKSANEYARKALAINPKYANAWAAMANSYLLERNFLSAKECALKANQYDPDNQSATQILKVLRRVR
ncbi:MAG: tetratricopeptide repeat protein [Cyanobacteria bacterium SZAS LIN-2]|nr:tetratricopeptide repeat protein [Cyanobacteria bacterium SZAS LIN-2]